VELHGIRTWYDQRHGVVAVEDDVQNVVRGIKAKSDRLHVFYNPQSEAFDIVESCLDGTDRLVLSAPQLDNRILDRLHLADHWHGRDEPEHVLGDDEDFVAKLDADQQAIWAAQEQESKDKLRAAGERLARALDVGVGVSSTISVSVDVDG